MTHVRRLHLTDAFFCKRLAADPVARAHSHDARLPEWKQHMKWMVRQTRDDNCAAFIVERDGQKIGLVRAEKKYDDEWYALVSISLTEDARGKGLGTHLLMWVAKWITQAWALPIVAEVETNNTASLKAFENAGYTKVPLDREGVVTFFYGKQKAAA